MWSPTKAVPAILAACLALAQAAAAPASVKVGSVFPPLTLARPAPGEGEAPLPETAGKVVLLDFWASWCGPCKASFPAYARLNTAYAGRGLQIVAVSVDDDPAACAAFVKKLAPPFPIVLDEKKLLVTAVNVPSLPTSFLIGRDGKVRFLHVGFHSGSTEKALRAEIETLLSEKG